MAKNNKTSNEVLSYRHTERRKNNPEVGMVSPDTDPDDPKTTYSYDPHIDPSLQFDSGRFAIEKLIDDALSSGDEAVMKAALEELKRQQASYLNWTGKAEKTSFEVDTVSLHVHERIDPASILSAVRKGLKKEKVTKTTMPTGQLGLFHAPFENLPLRDAIDFYKHDRGWANRLIAGDSLLVMNSLLQKEAMSGQLQMIFFDPPYGIKYGSNFQAFVDKREVKDKKDEDLTQEPEMIKAFRDTWELGVHSYLTYLRDRFQLAHQLLNDTGSIFIQISDENLHHIREILDEIFGAENFISIITFRTAISTNTIFNISDYLIWYCKDKSKVKINTLFLEKSDEKNDKTYTYTDSKGNAFKATDELWGISKASHFGPIKYQDKEYLAPGNKGYKWGLDGTLRLARANRLAPIGDRLYGKKLPSDFPLMNLTNLWADTATSTFSADKVYVVQTNVKVIERCMLMVSDPGDLVFDPTCGSGSTAYVAEKLGRRWMTCDTSRVSLALAKQRLMTASFDYYRLKYPHEGLKGGFIYETSPHITLASIAENESIDEISKRMQPEIDLCLSKLSEIVGQKLNAWTVPDEYPESWIDDGKDLFLRFHELESAMQLQINHAIASGAESVQLFNKPEIDRKKLRITGPFTVEAVPSPMVVSLDDDAPPLQVNQAISRSGESQRHHDWKDELIKTGIRGKNGQLLKLTDLETLPDVKYLHASGTIADTGERVVVSFGPEYSLLEQRQVEMAMREAGDLFPRPKMILFCSFDFDPEAAKDIDSTKGILALRIKMNADLLTDDLKKQRSSNQSFWLMGQPDVQLSKTKDGLWQVEVNGFDYFDTVKGELISGGKGNIASWMLDTDYDGRSTFPRQVFFPMAGSKDGWSKLRKEIKAELDEAALNKFSGTVSLPFEAGENNRIAVKIVDDRGIESLKVLDLEG